MTRTVIAEIVVPQRAIFVSLPTDPSPTAINAALVPSPNASMVNAPPAADAAPMAFISAA